MRPSPVSTATVTWPSSRRRPRAPQPSRWEPIRPGVGTPVVALGNPNGHGPRVTFGFVSGTGRSFRGPRGRRVAGAVEHTAPLMPGSSGGPVVDLAGNLLGINTNRLGNGFYLAIAADAVVARPRGRTRAR